MTPDTIAATQVPRRLPAAAAAPSPASPGVRVLIAAECGDRPLETADFLRRILPPGSRVRLLTVSSYEFEPDSLWGKLGSPASRLREPGPDAPTLRPLIDALESVGAKVGMVHRFGHAPDEILAEAADWAADLILVGHHNGLGRWFQASVAEALLKTSLIPVLVVPELSATASGRCRDQAS